MATSPDVSAYVDLRLFARTLQDVIDSMLASAAIKFPDWNPLEAHTETVLLEIMGEAIYELEQRYAGLPAAVFEGALRLLGIVRDPGAPVQVTLTITVPSSPAAQVIFAGSRLRYESLTGAISADLMVADEVTFPAGTTSLPVLAVGMTETASLNGISTGTVVPVDPLPFVDSIALAGSFAGGREPEVSADYLSRGGLRLSRLTTTLQTPEQFEPAALENPDVRRAKALQSFDPTVGTGVPGDHPGHITVAVIGPAGAPLDSGQKADLLAELDAEAFAPLIVHVIDSTITDVAVSASLQRESDYDDATVQANALAALEAYLSPDTWPYAAVVYHNELVSLLDQVPGVKRVITVTPSGDTTLTGVAPLADLSTHTITTST